MKKILFLLLLASTSIIQAQTKKCEIDYEIKNDSVNLIKLKDQLIFEKNFPDKTESILFSLIRNGEEIVLQFQWLEKSKEFTINRCFNNNSEIEIDLIDANSVRLKIYDNDICSQLIYDEVTKNNLRILNTYFRIEPTNLDKLLKSKMSLITVHFATGKEFYNIKDQLNSQNSETKTNPAFFFMEEYPCLKN